jgi:hypothetical protein
MLRVAPASAPAELQPETAMAAAAKALLASLDDAQRAKIRFAFADEERFNWHFIPRERQGLSLKAMNDAQRKAAFALLRAGLSAKGYTKVETIRSLELVLRAIEGSARRDPELYFFTIFGTPSAKSPWGWRVEGHHVSLHFSIANNTAVASTPSFFGTNPAEVREDGPKKGLRILGAMEDSARALLESLDDEQKKSALITDVAPTEILTKTETKVDLINPPGIAASALKPAQRDLLTKVLESYTSQMADDISAERLAKIKQAGIEKITFAWAGPLERGKQHYYRVQGPTFLVEYDNSQNQGNHVHSVWRDFAGDFGRDVLREHLKSVAH